MMNLPFAPYTRTYWHACCSLKSLLLMIVNGKMYKIIMLCISFMFYIIFSLNLVGCSYVGVGRVGNIHCFYMNEISSSELCVLYPEMSTVINSSHASVTKFEVEIIEDSVALDMRHYVRAEQIVAAAERIDGMFVDRRALSRQYAAYVDVYNDTLVAINYIDRKGIDRKFGRSKFDFKNDWINVYTSGEVLQYGSVVNITTGSIVLRHNFGFLR